MATPIPISPTVKCLALFIAAPASGQGKTTVTAALARLLSRQGKHVRVFKTGPDYLDPQILAQASGHPVEQLDMWMAGEGYCQQKLYEAAQTADIILVEGVMGMFDGDPSSADLASRYNIPMAILMDVKGMAQTAAAVVIGLANFRDDITVAGLIANNCSTERHRELIENALPDSLPLLATLERSDQVALPERHLGLVQADENTDELERRFEAGADWLEAAGAANILERLTAVEFYPEIMPAIAPLLEGVSLGIAKDIAFSFIYESNLRLLREMGAELFFFSPLFDEALPEVDALWFPGGYPELHAKALSENHTIIKHIKAFFEQDKPILAECGGLLYCLQTLTDLEGAQYPMAGLLEGHGTMSGKRGCQGMQTAQLPEGDVRAHAHHRSRCVEAPEPIAYGRRQRHSAPGEAIYRCRQLTASYLHLFFPSNPSAIAELFNASEVHMLEAQASEC
ncbi:cobyrinate a,c-diamide synthase [Alkalimarinus alittae]|uniref:Cobyrinate a,c-diamide synthase n=1 Tax=Alkalimarinus alittae TaxID=2961619 RepID=A0ABY6N5S8_9ALTE|nr:cobyrinate a,c-diamide synthase [Alkalimarinus alittae]UZE97481.1 cobyrinate a,c-diamide synthase [Alkalimarinus alittae]